MQFLSDVYLRCPDCDGTRFRVEVREVKVNGKSISDVLELTVSEAIAFFADIKGGAEVLRAPAAARGCWSRLCAPRAAGANAFRR